MIVELFGPPCAGKTTFACALVDHLRAKDQAARLWLSHRPAEKRRLLDEDKRRISDVSSFLERMLRPTGEVIVATTSLANAGNVSLAPTLLKSFSVEGTFQRVKRWQYIVRLCHGWQAAQRGEAITVFDQGFIQLICSLALATGQFDDLTLTRALAVVPQSDLAICLEAPSELLYLRLEDRARTQGPLERKLESRSSAVVGSVQLIQRLRKLLRQSGRRVVTASSLDASSLQESVNDGTIYLLQSAFLNSEV
jgi:hypothetical protein